MESIQNAFIHAAHVVNRIDAACVFTVPITYATSSIVRIADESLPELLYKMIAIEYRNHGLWFDLHPAVRELHKQKQAVIAQCKATSAS